MKFRNVMYQDAPDVEVNSGDNNTVPDQALSVKEILRRHTMQLPLPRKQVLFDTDGLPDGLETMSKTDLQIAKKKAENKVKQSQDRLAVIQAAKAKAERDLTFKNKNDEKEV